MTGETRDIIVPGPAQAAEVEVPRSALPATGGEASAPSPAEPQHDERISTDTGGPPGDRHGGESEAVESEVGTNEVSTIDGAAGPSAATIESAVNAGVERILAAFEAKLAYDASKQIQVDRLHSELQQHRGDLVARVARPLVHGMIRVHDDMGKLLSALRAKSADELTPERFFSLLEGLQEDVEIVLGQNGVAAYREPGGPFDPRRQRVLRKVGTGEEALAGAVAESIRPGFEQGTEILEKERVATYEFFAPPVKTQGRAAPEAVEADLNSPEPQKREE